MDCPKCSGPLSTFVDGPVTHMYCQACQPKYAEPPGVIEQFGTLLFVAVTVPLYPVARVYLFLSGKSY